MSEWGRRRARIIWTVLMLYVVLAVLGLNWIASLVTPQPPPPSKSLLSEDIAYRLHLALGDSTATGGQQSPSLALVNAGTFQQQAIEGYEAVADESPDDAASRLRLGVIEGRRQRPDDAREYLERAREIDPDEGHLYDALLLVYAADDPPPKLLLSAQPTLDAAPAWLRDAILPDLYDKAGDRKAANMAREAARKRSGAFLAKVGGLAACSLALLIGGLAVLVGWLAVHLTGRDRRDAVPRSFPAWSLLDFLEAFAVWLFTSLVVAFVVLALTGGKLEELASPGAQVAVLAASYLPPAAIVLLLLRKRATERNLPTCRAFGWVLQPVGGLVSIGIAGYVASVPLMMVAALISQKISPTDPFSTNPAMPVVLGADTIGLRLVIVGLLAVVAPIAEETIFRGVAYSALRARWGVRMGIIVSAAIFALMHHDLPTFLPLLMLGAVFAYLYESTGSIVPSIIAHACQNGVTTVAIWVLSTL